MEERERGREGRGGDWTLLVSRAREGEREREREVRERERERETIGAAAGPTVTRTVSGVVTGESSRCSPFTERHTGGQQEKKN